MREARGERRKEKGLLAPASRRPVSFLLSPLRVIAAIAAITLAGCGSLTTRETTPPVARAPDSTPAPAKPATPRGGGYYLNDGPGDNPPPNLDQVPDAVPKLEPLRPATMRPYTVMGQTYTPMTRLAPYKERGIASWYGRRYHEQKTSSGEIYDMYGMTAAHTILPIPSYARVTNLATNKSVVVRINDRGPFHSDRLIDLSYTAAYKLGVLGGGKAMVEVETIIPDAGTPLAAAALAPAAATPPAPAPAPAITATPLPPPAAPVAVPLPAEPAPPAVSTEATAPQSVTASAAAPNVAVTADQKGLFLQLGAFGSQDNAENFLARLKAQMDWLASSLHVYARDGLYRVNAGPYANQVDARAAAERIGQELGIKPMVLVR
jgi:rare lipoprotein A